MRISPVVFGLVYSCAYVVVLATDWALFMYYPQTGEFTLGWNRRSDSGPGMAWYGLMGSAAVVALAAALIPGDRLANALRNSLWVVPFAAMLGCLYLMRHFFLR